MSISVLFWEGAKRYVGPPFQAFGEGMGGLAPPPGSATGDENGSSRIEHSNFHDSKFLDKT